MKTPGKNTAAKAASAKKTPVGKAEAKLAPKKAAASKPMTKKVLARKPVAPAPPAPAPFSVQASAQSSAQTSATPPGAGVMDRLFTVITERRTADPSLSHSARLLSRGMPKVAQKFGEEAVECLIEALEGNAEALVAESADVLYHLLVLWVAAGIEPNQVWAELTRREGVSGVAEKATRARPYGTTKIP